MALNEHRYVIVHPLLVSSSVANKVEIVREGAVPPLLSLSHSTDLKVQRNAAGALLNLTHIGESPNDGRPSPNLAHGGKAYSLPLVRALT